MKKIISALLLLSFTSFAENRIKDLVTIKGVRENPLIGYGLVIGLNGTGDSGGEVTNDSLKSMFQKLGLNPKKEVSSKNVASVVVTAKMPAFGRVGQKMDVTISSIGDASSLAGGTLLVTPLRAGDGKIYAVSSGALSIGGLEQGSKFATTGRIPDGGIIENELDVEFNKKKAIRLALKNSDFTTAARIEKVINQELGGRFASAVDSSTVDVIIPPHYQRKVVKMVALMENYKVIPDSKAKIVINERTGTIVAGGGIQLKKVAISHNDLIIEVADKKTGTNKREALHLVDQTTTLNDLVKALNTLGATPEDLISIFQTLKKNGALTADIELI